MSIEREHAPYHERRLEQQTLDALLRIEELLTTYGAALVKYEDGEISEVVSPEDFTKTEEVEIATADLKDGKPSVSHNTRGKRK